MSHRKVAFLVVKFSFLAIIISKGCHLMDILEELKYRGLIEQYSSEEEIKKLLKEPTVIYCGFDPSASSLHLGNYVMISLLKRLQLAGHKIIAVVGGATGMIGDPSGKSKERNLQTKEKLFENTEAIHKQLSRFLDLTNPDKGELLNNYDWLGHMYLLDFLRDYGKYFSVNYMLSKEIVSSRLESGISFTEFSYQILQSVDFLYLYDHKNVRIQIGGNDQWGNLTSGLELIRKVKGENVEAEALTAHLITRSDGKKFGKSEDGALFLDPALTSPYKLYQYFMNVTDEDAVKYLKVFTFLSIEEIEENTKNHLANPGQRIAQKALAFQVTKDIHGEKEAEHAVNISELLFKGEIQSLSEKDIEDVLGSLKVEVEDNIPLLDLLVKVGAAQSKTQARTFVKQNSISLNGEKVTDENAILNKKAAFYGRYFVIKKGKKNYYLGEIK